MNFIRFIYWCFAKVGMGMVNAWDDYCDMLRRETFLAIIFGMLITMLLSVGGGGLVAAVTGSGLCGSIAFIIIVVVCVGAVVYRLINMAYTAFKQERRELFETIKRG